MEAWGDKEDNYTLVDRLGYHRLIKQRLMPGKMMKNSDVVMLNLTPHFKHFLCMTTFKLPSFLRSFVTLKNKTKYK